MMGLLRGSALVVLACGIAAAQPKPAPTAPTQAQKDKIQTLAKAAIAKSQAGDHDGAIKDFLDAFAVNPDAAVAVLSNVGYEYKQIKKPYEALKYFCLYLERAPTGPAASYVRDEARALHVELKLTGEVCAKREDTRPPDPLPDINNTGTTEPPPTGNGQVTGTQTPIKDEPKPSDPGKTQRMVGLGVAAGGAIALGAGILFGIQAKDKADQITAGPPVVGGVQLDWGPHPEAGWDGIAKLQSDGNKLEKMQIVFTGLGGAMVIGGVVIYALGHKKGSEHVAVLPTIGSGNAGLALTGGF